MGSFESSKKAASPIVDNTFKTATKDPKNYSSLNILCNNDNGLTTRIAPRNVAIVEHIFVFFKTFNIKFCVKESNPMKRKSVKPTKTET